MSKQFFNTVRSPKKIQNFEVFRWNISSSINLFFLKSDIIIKAMYLCSAIYFSNCITLLFHFRNIPIYIHKGFFVDGGFFSIHFSTLIASAKKQTKRTGLVGYYVMTKAPMPNRDVPFLWYFGNPKQILIYSDCTILD